MKHSNLPATRDLVLVGGGHTHALVLRKWGMRPLPGVRVTVINPGPTAPYSGMLPGHVAGHYPREALDIDLVQLAQFAGARVVIGEVEEIDLTVRQVLVPGRPAIGFDLASVNIGITSSMPALQGFAEHAVPAKPLGPFATRWAAYVEQSGPASVVVIGGGVAGAEIAAGMAYALKDRGRPASVVLIDNTTALAAIGETAAAKLRTALIDLGVELVEKAEINCITAGSVDLSDGRQIPAEFVTGAAGARPYDWVSRSGLDLHKGFIRVDETLRSSDPHVFAVGDCAHLDHAPRPKAGVYAVREAPVLYDNICAALSGGQLRAYNPQSDYLKLISLGGKSALAERFGMTPSGPLMWRWKDRIDRKFMQKFRDLPAMEGPEVPPVHADGLPEALGEKPFCGGCGAKLGRNALRVGLAGLAHSDRDDITALPGDDAALLLTGGTRQVISSDHLRSLTPDPVLMTRIAAIHALGDIWAMSAKPQAATATLILPRMAPALQERTLREIMEAADEVMSNAGAAIVGGHSSMGDEMTIGFTVTGLCDTDPVTLAGGKPGDALILTKPIGTGVIMAAAMAGKARGEDVTACYEAMMQPQGAASHHLQNAHAMTDVTGFGLAGHLAGLCEASGCGAILDLAAIPTLPGAEDLSSAGIRSTIFPENRVLAMDLAESGKNDLLFDPQTAGGLLAAVDPASANSLLTALVDAGYPAAIIGHLSGDTLRITLQT
ncbi:selenide, water dikinase SelD [Primorskyibacter sp. S87]|uniref:selenide, water dikinase SelD n=1 Tax=Primorskyibacter sp. S87 TaxID=3415126 RepID=UPI003C7AD54A